MLSSYQFSERVSFQSLLWDSCGLIVEIIRKTTAIVGRIFAVVSHFLPTLLLALGLTAACVAGATRRLVQMSRQTPPAAHRACVWLYALLLTLGPDVAALVRSVAKVTAWSLAIVGIVGGLALLMCNPMVLVGLALTAGYAVVFMPRKAVRK